VNTYASGNYVGAYLLSAVTYTYNADGTLATKTDAKSQKLTYTYDGYGRLLQVGSGNPVTAIRTYTYDTYPANSTYAQLGAG